MSGLELLNGLVFWFIGLGIHLILTSSLLISSTWSLLVVFRVLRIPWIDGTTSGFLERK